MVFVDDVATSDIQVKVMPGEGVAHRNKWYVNGKPTTHAHEVTHGALGIEDEYVDTSGNAPDRVSDGSPGVHDDQSIMGNYWIGHWSEGNVDPGTSVKQRHLDEISRHVPPRPAETTNEPTTNPRTTEAEAVGRNPSSPDTSPRGPESSDSPASRNAREAEARKSEAPAETARESPDAERVQPRVDEEAVPATRSPESDEARPPAEKSPQPDARLAPRALIQALYFGRLGRDAGSRR